MSEAMEEYERAMEATGIEDPHEALIAYIDSWDESGNYNDDEEIEYDIGCVVKLNSSSFHMTISDIDGDILTCRWFDKNKTLQSATFHQVEICLVSSLENSQNYIESEAEIINEDEIPF